MNRTQTYESGPLLEEFGRQWTARNTAPGAVA